MWLRKWIAPVGIVVVFWVLTCVLLNRVAPEPLDSGRSRLRQQYLSELTSSNQVALTTYGWIDRRRGIVRLPLEAAMDMSVVLWQDPAGARSNLLERLSKATAKLTPINIYE